MDVEHDFQPIYVVNADKKAQVKKLKELLARTPTNSSSPPMRTARARPSRGTSRRSSSPRSRSTGWSSTRSPRTRSAAAVANPRELNQRMVDAQETRRILDRLYGYEVSPVLWKKVMPRLSAGRVQSVATRLVVERERERIAFRSAEYWDLTGTFAHRPRR